MPAIIRSSVGFVNTLNINVTNPCAKDTTNNLFYVRVPHFSGTDLNLESVKGIASFVSPVPGGVGPVAVAMLLQNVLIVAKNKNDNK